MTTSKPDDALLSQLPSLQQDPIFILGLARSGTTLLYDLLGKTGAFETMTAYHMLCFDSLMQSHLEGETAAAKQALTERFHHRGNQTRGIDNVSLNADIPEEYGAFLMMRHKTRRLSARTDPTFRLLCRKMQFISERPGRPILHKNPADYGRFREVKALYPQAKFVFIHRHPLHVLSSSLKALMHVGLEENAYFDLQREQMKGIRRVLRRVPGMRSVFRTMATSDLAMSLIQRRIVQYINRTTGVYFDHIGELPQDDYICVKYESLCAEPTKTIEEICRFCGVTSSAQEEWENEISPRPVKLAPTIQAREQQVRAQLASTMKALGYTV